MTVNPNLVQWDRKGPITESFFLKFLIPQTGLSVWLRFTITNTADFSHGALWAVISDKDSVVATRQAFPTDQVRFSGSRFFLKIGESWLEPGLTKGEIHSQGHDIKWDLGFETPAPSFRHLPLPAYHKTVPFPEVKLLSPYVDTRFYGTVTMDGRQFTVQHGPGMIGHNWTWQRFPYKWLWIHCNAFDGPTDTCVEIAASQVHPSLPFIATGYLQLGKQQLLFNSPVSLIRNRVTMEDESTRVILRRGGLALKAIIRPAKGIKACYVAPSGKTGECENTAHADLQLAIYNIRPGEHGPYMTMRSSNCTLETFNSGPCKECVLDDRIF